MLASTIQFSHTTHTTQPHNNQSQAHMMCHETTTTQGGVLPQTPNSMPTIPPEQKPA
ncbi:hypothetical protein GCM10027157_16680 [Corynebacterium aquatimens]